MVKKLGVFGRQANRYVFFYYYLLGKYIVQWKKGKVYDY